jgi:hypothetical protein
MRPLWKFFTAASISILIAAPLQAEQTSALIAQALDRQLPKTEIHFNGTLPQIIQQFADTTGVRIEADESVYDALPGAI